MNPPQLSFLVARSLSSSSSIINYQSKSTIPMELNNVLDFSRRGSANISSLKRADENFLDIVGEANHAVLYQFDPISSRWNKMEYEGAIFAIRWKQMPIYSLLLLNRLGHRRFS